MQTISFLTGKTKMIWRMKIFEFIKRISGKQVSLGVQATPSDKDMKKFLIVGLGNIGREYIGTRHNAGFLIADRLTSENGGQFKSCRYGDMATFKIKNCELNVLKPSTYMNLSGVAVRYWMNKFKLPLPQLLVLVDDIAIPFGTIRLRESGSEGGHNGLKSISEHLGNRNYARLRFGVGDAFQKGSQIDYVLGQFNDEEKKLLDEKIERACEAVKAFCLSGPSFAMTHFNG